ncbi:hypothetical protein ACQJBY_010625 [Aegilops geniculata]
MTMTMKVRITMRPRCRRSRGWCGQVTSGLTVKKTPPHVAFCFLLNVLASCSKPIHAASSFLLLLVAEAVPKRILQLMNVEKFPRENIASHLQILRFLCHPELEARNHITLPASCPSMVRLHQEGGYSFL